MTRLQYTSFLLWVFLGLVPLAYSSDTVEPSSWLPQSPTLVLPDGKEIYLLNAKQGAEAIFDDRGEPFFSMLTTLDLSVRMGAALNPKEFEKNKDRFAQFLKSNVCDWTSAEEKAFLEVLKEAHDAAVSITPDLIPQKWVFIKTTGSEEGGAFYTRGSSVVVPQESLTHLLETSQSDALVREMIHESFHLYSRTHPEQRARLYQCIGFSKLGSLVLGSQLARRRLTNPDAPDFSYSITLKNAKGEPFRAILVTFSKVPEFTPGQDGLFSYVTFGLFEVRLNGESWKVATDQHGDPHSLDPDTARGFYEQIGRNTPYILHPEEILADNTAILAISRGNLSSLKDIANPELLAKVEAILKESTQIKE